MFQLLKLGSRVQGLGFRKIGVQGSGFVFLDSGFADVRMHVSSLYVGVILEAHYRWAVYS